MNNIIPPLGVHGEPPGPIGHDCLGDLRLSGSIIQKSRFILTKERRNIRQKSG